MVVIMGACGTTASKTAEQMLAQNRRVRVIDKSPDCLRRLGEKGAEIFWGDQTDESFLTKAFTGFDTVCMFTHAKPESGSRLKYHTKMIEAAVGAIKKTSIKRVVFLSNLTPEHETETSSSAVLREAEKRLCGLENVNTVIVRTGFVLENLIADGMRQTAACSTESPFFPYTGFSMVTSSEIGDKIAELVDKPHFSGNSIVTVIGRKWTYYQ
jgi:uncharacterized protein YbjT (DUF2867 family)